MIPIPGLFSAIPLRAYLWGGLVLAVGGYIGVLNVQRDNARHKVILLEAELNTKDAQLQGRDALIKAQNVAIDGWVAAGQENARKAAQAQKDAKALADAHAEALKALEAAQAPTNSDAALIWVARSYNEWTAKVRP